MTSDTTFNTKIQNAEPFLWLNPNLFQHPDLETELPVSPDDVIKAHENWRHLAPLLKSAFDILTSTNGQVESDLIPTPELQEALGLGPDTGTVYVKADHDLPVAGSIKARGGLYEVCMHAWALAKQASLAAETDTTDTLLRPDIQQFFSKHRIAVGSTGNLGLSVGLAARALGFKATVHMSSDAKAWKVKRLTDIGAEVVQHKTDYGSAVDQARIEAAADPKTYFVDDERSELLFHGYSAAAVHLKTQLDQQAIMVDAKHPLFIYLPCGIGGAPGGIAYGVKTIFGRHAHCFFVEPAQAPCAMVQLHNGLSKPVSVYNYGLTNKTEADGMAVAQVSMFVATIVRNLLSGVFTVADDDLFRWLYLAKSTEDLKLEPSAAACIAGPGFLTKTPEGLQYQKNQGLNGDMQNATHILWATGGSLVPDTQYEAFFEKGRLLNI
jgi:D-serine dehydratase